MSTTLIIINLCILGVLAVAVGAFAWMLYADRKGDPLPNAALDSVYMDWLEKKTKRAGGFLLHDGSERGRVGLGLKAANGPARTLRQAVHEAMGNAAIVESRRADAEASRKRTYSLEVNCGNCFWNGDIHLPIGTPFSATNPPCPNCGDANKLSRQQP
jgi:hypothetical protein